jgi:hypothetical protein
MNFDILVLMIFLAAISIIFGPVIWLIIRKIQLKIDNRKYILSRKPGRFNYQREPEYEIFKFLTNSDSKFHYLDEWSYSCKNKSILIFSKCISFENQQTEYNEFKKTFENWVQDPIKINTKNILRLYNLVELALSENYWIVSQLEKCSGKVVYTDRNNSLRVIFSERLKVFQIIYHRKDDLNKKVHWWASKYIKMDEIIGLEVKDAEKTIASDTRARNALVGSLLFGRIGALIGASLSSNNSSLLIRLNDTKNPVYEIDCKDRKKLYELVTLFEIYEKKWSE